MKFMMGHWMSRPEVTPLYASEVYRCTRDGNDLILLLPSKHVEDRSGTQIGALRVRLTAPAEGIIGVTLTHHGGEKQKKPMFELHKENIAPDIVETDDEIVFGSGDLRAKISKKPSAWGMEYTWKGKHLTGTGFRGMACMMDGWVDSLCGMGAETLRNYMIGSDKEKGKCWMQEALELDVGECVYGLGERFTPFVKNGQTVDMWQGDGGSCSEMAYKNVPFYYTNRGYGVFVDHPGNVSFEVGSENVERVQFAVEGQSLTYYIFGGDTIPEVLKRYTGMTGRPALPPAWSFGLWLSTSFTTNYDEHTVTSFIDGMEERGIPLSVFHFDCYWMRAFKWCDFIWDGATFPEPANMLARLKKHGLHICVWINPYIAEDSVLFNEGMEKGYLLHRTDGSVWQTDLWQAGMGIVDFTNPDACAWYRKQLRKLLDDGVDCFKTDFGERIPVLGVKWYDGSDPERMHNYYTHLYNKTVFDLVKEKRGEGDALVFARSATAGGQQFPVHWGGDNSASYVSMAETLRAGLSLTSCGFGFWSHDISGFESTAPADVYKRWCAFGLLSSHSRLHGSHSYRVPWLFDDEASEVLAYFVKLKHRLMPYLYQMAVNASNEGIPMMRPMVMMFPEDPACASLDRQYMLGDSLLVAPVFSKSGDVDFYLPNGRWTNLLDGRRKNGGTWVHDVCDFMQIPIWVREDTVLPVGAETERPDYDYAKNVELRVFELSDKPHSVTVPDLTGKVAAVYDVRKVDGQIRVITDTDEPYSILTVE